MPSQAKKSQHAITIALTLGTLAMTLGAPAFAAARVETFEGALPIAANVPPAPTIPIRGQRQPSRCTAGPGLTGAWDDVLQLLISTLTNSPVVTVTAADDEIKGKAR